MKLIRSFACLLIFALLIPTASAQSFTDSANNQYVNAIEYVRQKGIVEGYSDGTYRPNQEISRAEFTKIIIGAKFDINAIDLCLTGRAETTEDKNIFTDVDDEQWYSKYICVAKEKGIVDGYKDGSFKPGANVNFVEAAKILVNTFDINPGESGENWYQEFVLGLQHPNYIPPTISSLDQKITRGEMAELINRVLEQDSNRPAKLLLDDGEPITKTPEATPPTKADPNQSQSGDPTAADEWRKLVKSTYEFMYPATWSFGTKGGRIYVSEEKDYIDNLQAAGNFDVKTYVVAYEVPLSSKVLPSNEALRIENTFDHPLVEEEELEINGTPALRRHYRAEEGATVNGRETQVAENIFQYTYHKEDTVFVLQYFIAYTREDYNLDIFEKMAASFKVADQPRAELSETASN